MSSSRRTTRAADATSEVLTLETDLGWAIRTISATFRRLASASVADLPGGARGYLVLVALAGGERPTQLALAKQLSLDRTVMTYLLDDLEADGLVARKPDPRDRRARQVVITDAGRTRLATVRRSLLAAEEELLSELSDVEARRLRTLLSRAAQRAHRDTTDPDEREC